jgi:hypothetical protein
MYAASAMVAAFLLSISAFAAFVLALKEEEKGSSSPRPWLRSNTDAAFAKALGGAVSVSHT